MALTFLNVFTCSFLFIRHFEAATLFRSRRTLRLCSSSGVSCMSAKKESRTNICRRTTKQSQQLNSPFLRKLTRNQISTSYINISNEKIMTGHFPGEGTRAMVALPKPHKINLNDCLSWFGKFLVLASFPGLG